MTTVTIGLGGYEVNPLEAGLQRKHRSGMKAETPSSRLVVLYNYLSSVKGSLMLAPAPAPAPVLKFRPYGP